MARGQPLPKAFRDPPKTLSLYHQIEAYVQRFKEHFFLNTPENDLLQLPEYQQPLVPLDPENIEVYFPPHVMLRERKLAYVWESEETWATDFKNNLGGSIGSVTAARNKACQLFREHAEHYNSCRNTHLKGGQRRKTRRSDESQTEYRKRLYRLSDEDVSFQFPLQTRDIVAFKQKIIDCLINPDVRGETRRNFTRIRAFNPEYTLPRTPLEAKADLIVLALYNKVNRIRD